MISFLFWNIARKRLESLVAKAAHLHNVDVILLAECEDPYAVLIELNTNSQGGYNYHHVPASKVKVFSRYILHSVQQLCDYEGLSFRKLIPPIGNDLLLIAAHLRSKYHNTDEDQWFATTQMHRVIKEQEANIGHRRTIVIGDLNMNPFEKGLIAAHGFHSTMSRRIASSGYRNLRGESYPYFYNPMWSHLGDKGSRPPGTYYYNNSQSVNMFWNMFDQVLIRPELLPFFREEDLQILTSIGTTSLLDHNGRPNQRLGSDHLPIVLLIDLLPDDYIHTGQMGGDIRDDNR